MMTTAAEEESLGSVTAKLPQVLTTITSLSQQEEKLSEKPDDFKAKNMDDALQLGLESKGLIIDEDKEKKLMRKVDWYIMPILVCLMSCQLMDKTTTSYASIMGLRTDLHMHGNMYSWVGSSFYFGFMVFEYPANMLMQKFLLSKTLGIVIICWAIILMCHAACTSYAPFIVVRVLLGMCESAMNPAYVLLTSQWYKKEEQFLRTCIWFGFQGFGTLCGATIAYELALHEHSYKLEAWRLLYIITGVITLFLGCVSLIHIPDIPSKAWFLNSEEKKYIVERIRNNQQGFGNHVFKINQFKEAFLDVRTWILFVFGFCYSVPNGGFTNFGSILLNKDFGFSSTRALLMNMPGGAIDIIFPLCAGLINKHFIKSRILISLAFNTVTLIGICLLAFSKPKGSRLFGYYSFYIATVTMCCMTSVISSNTAGYTKKITVSSIFFVGYCVGNISGPQTFKSSQAPNYSGAKIAMVVSFAVSEVLLIAMYYLNVSENRRRDARRDKLGLSYVKMENAEFSDLTDKENQEFRYSY